MAKHKKLINVNSDTDTAPVSRAIANPTRTAVQMAPSIAVTEFIDAFLVNLNEQQYIALAAVLLLVFGFAQNLYEQFIGKAFLK